MTRPRIAILLALAAAASWLSAARPGLADGSSDPYASEFDARDLARERQHAAEAARHATGPGSCSALGCHPGPYKLWQDEKLGTHFKAFEALRGPRSLEMARRLHASDGSGADPRARADCLACHAFAQGVPREASGEPRVEDGVSCEACHGRAKDWLATHNLKDAEVEARLRAAGQKAELAEWAATPAPGRRALRMRWWGLQDLRDVRRASETCLACHLGTGERRVSHALLAAGHPPLAFELARDLEKVPKHWKEKTRLLDGESEPSLAARTWESGQLVALRESLRDVAAGRVDYASFECASCHHAITTAVGDRPSWQGTSLDGEPGPLGEPRWSPQAWMVARRALSNAADATRGSEDARAIFRGLTPHGASDGARAAARELMHIADHAAVSASNRPVTPADARAALLSILADREAIARAGYRSAEQAVFALDALANDGGALTPEELKRIDAPLGALLRLVAGPDPDSRDWRAGAARSAAFDASELLKPMAEIAAQLGEKPK